MHGQASVTVTHEDLRDVEDGNLHITGGLHREQPRVTNLVAGYN
jgi:hypothetical protein